MRRTTSFFKGFLSVHFFRHSAGIAAFMLFTFSIMSFKFGGHAAVSKNIAKDDSSEVSANKAFANLLSNPLADNTVAMRQVFKLNAQLQPFYKDYSRREAEEYGDMKTWGKPYLDMMDEILVRNDLPLQLKYLCVIESNLKAGTVSSSGATGPWQLMREEGRMYGLVMSKSYDERKDFEKSTEVAAGLLKSLYNQFGDWLLAIAAYNCGNGAMRRAIALAHSDDYWVVQKYLSEQARNYIKKYIATCYIFDGCGGWTTVTNQEAVACSAEIAKLTEKQAGVENFTDNSTATVEIRGQYNSGILVNALFLDGGLFNRLNPNLDAELLQGKSYQLTLPADKMPLFQANKKLILEKSAQLLVSSAFGK